MSAEAVWRDPRASPAIDRPWTSWRLAHLRYREAASKKGRAAGARRRDPRHGQGEGRDCAHLLGQVLGTFGAPGK